MKGVLSGSYRYSLEGPALVSVSINDLDNGNNNIYLLNLPMTSSWAGLNTPEDKNRIPDNHIKLDKWSENTR